MKVPFLDLHAQYQSIKTEIDMAIARVIKNTAFIGGKEVTAFETAFAGWQGANFAVGCANGTDAIELALEALGIGPDDEVIVPACTWISTAGAVSRVGAKPVFADILPDLYTIDPHQVEKKITPKTKAIIPVHLYGMPCDMDPLLGLAKQYGLKIIEDCAQAHGAQYKGQKVGNFGDLATFSFYPGKNLGAYGDGGAVTTNDEVLAKKVRVIANHGQAGKHNHIQVGRNSRLDGLHAAILSAKLPHLDAWNAARLRIAESYLEVLKEKDLALPVIPNYATPVFHLFVVRVKNRDSVMKKLSESGIGSAIHYPTPLPAISQYQEDRLTERYPIAMVYKDEILSIPIFPELTEDQVQYVADHL